MLIFMLEDRFFNIGPDPRFMHNVPEGLQNLPEKLVQDFMSEREKYVFNAVIRYFISNNFCMFGSDKI